MQVMDMHTPAPTHTAEGPYCTTTAATTRQVQTLLAIFGPVAYSLHALGACNTQATVPKALCAVCVCDLVLPWLQNWRCFPRSSKGKSHFQEH